MFKFLLGFISIIIAGCAAFFSVQGVASLYSDQFLAVCIMASSLEIGKLVAATYLHRFWRETGGLLKTYLSVAVAILMAITSLGIFGFLTAAYQKNFSQVELVDSKQEMFQTRKNFLEKEIASLNERISTLNEARTSQEKRLPSLSRISAKPIYEDIERAGKEIQSTREKIDLLSKQLIESSDEMMELKVKKNDHHDIGTLQHVANALGVKVDLVVNWFTLIIVVVFDPLALSLILAYSTLTEKKPTHINSLSPNNTENDSNSISKPLQFSTDGSYRQDKPPLIDPEEAEMLVQNVSEQGDNIKTEANVSYAYEDHLNEILKITTSADSVSREVKGKYRL